MLPAPPGWLMPPNWASAADGCIASARSTPPETIRPTFDNSMSSKVSAKSSVKVASIASGMFRRPRAVLVRACAAVITAVIAAASVAAPGGVALCASASDRLLAEDAVSSVAERSDAADAAVLARPLPDGMRVPSYSPGPMPYHPGQQLIYQASWIGIPAAGGKVVLNA